MFINKPLVCSSKIQYKQTVAAAERRTGRRGHRPWDDPDIRVHALEH